MLLHRYELQNPDLKPVQFVILKLGFLQLFTLNSEIRSYNSCYKNVGTNNKEGATITENNMYCENKSFRKIM